MSLLTAKFVKKAIFKPEFTLSFLQRFQNKLEMLLIPNFDLSKKKM